MKIRLVDGSVHEVTRAEVTNGRLEIDIKDKTAEEIRDIFLVPALISNIELLMDTDEKIGDVPGWTAYGGVLVLRDIKTVILTQPVDAVEQRLITVEADAFKAMMAVNAIQNDEVLNASVMVARVSAQALSDTDALRAKAIYSTWEELSAQGFMAEEAGYKFTYNENLYKTVHENQSFQAEWIPGQGTESIFTRIDEKHLGTLEDPIPAVPNMEYVRGMYYLEDGRIYLMNREGMENGESIVLQFLPSVLVGQYFEAVS